MTTPSTTSYDPSMTSYEASRAVEIVEVETYLHRLSRGTPSSTDTLLAAVRIVEMQERAQVADRNRISVIALLLGITVCAVAASFILTLVAGH